MTRFEDLHVHVPAALGQETIAPGQALDRIRERGWSALPAPLALAGGGLVRGPGGPQDDLVPALLSAGEAVIPAHAVARFPEVIQALLQGNPLPSYTSGTPGAAKGSVPRAAVSGVAVSGAAVPGATVPGAAMFARGGETGVSLGGQPLQRGVRDILTLLHRQLELQKETTALQAEGVQHAIALAKQEQAASHAQLAALQARERGMSQGRARAAQSEDRLTLAAQRPDFSGLSDALSKTLGTAREQADLLGDAVDRTQSLLENAARDTLNLDQRLGGAPQGAFAPPPAAPSSSARSAAGHAAFTGSLLQDLVQRQAVPLLQTLLHDLGVLFDEPKSLMESLEQRLKQASLSLIQQLERMAWDAARSNLSSVLDTLGAGLGGGSAGTPWWFSLLRGIAGFADGGFVRGQSGGRVRGPGGPKGDRIPALLSAGEAVIPAQAVAQNPALVAALIRGDLDGAQGGQQPGQGPRSVTPPASANAPASSQAKEAVDMTNTFNLTVNTQQAGLQISQQVTLDANRALRREIDALIDQRIAHASRPGNRGRF